VSEPPNVIVVSFKANEELIRKMDALSHRLRITRSELIRRAVEKFIARYESRFNLEGEWRVKRVVLY